MDIIICGAGEVGRHAAEVLAAGRHSVTVIDLDASRLRALEDVLDIRTLAGNSANAEVLLEADVDGADMVIAATSDDEVNLVTASIAKGLGARKTIARVHLGLYFEQRSMSYQAHFGIDRLICPEYSTALAIAQILRNPGALAIEHFARGQIEMQQFPVSATAPAIGRPLSEIRLPKGTRLAAIGRGGKVTIPTATSTLAKGDFVVLVGNTAHFNVARKFFYDEKAGRKNVVIMGGPPMAVWLCRALRDRNISIRLFEIKEERAKELADLLDWVTVIHADPTDRAVFDEERIADADAFVALAHDEENILGCLLAKTMGVPQSIAVVERPNYIPLLERLGIDRPFTPRLVAVKEIERVLDESPLRQMTSLAEGQIDVYRVRVSEDAPVVGKPLKEVRLAPDWVAVAIQRGEEIHVPGPDDEMHVGDTVLVVGRHGMEDTLRTMFRVK
jgi:trk system potassium uptake protein TrkA